VGFSVFRPIDLCLSFSFWPGLLSFLTVLELRLLLTSTRPIRLVSSVGQYQAGRERLVECLWRLTSCPLKIPWITLHSNGPYLTFFQGSMEHEIREIFVWEWLFQGSTQNWWFEACKFHSVAWPRFSYLIFLVLWCRYSSSWEVLEAYQGISSDSW